MFKKIFKFFLTGLLLFFLAKPVMAKKSQAVVHFFWAYGCPHCAQEKVFLNSLEEKYSQLEVRDYEVSGSRENSELLQKIGKRLSTDVSGVPFTVIGEHYVVGYLDDQTTGKEIEKFVNCALENGCDDLVANLNNQEDKEHKLAKMKNLPQSIKLPFLGTVETKDLSLPALTFFIAFLDGFNPCAMWTLVFLISLLLGMENRRRMWILGVAFIVSSAFVYFLFLSAWLNLFLFLGFISGVRIVVGLVALFAGGYYLRDYLVNKTGACKVTGGQKKQKVFERIKEITQKKQFIFALGGIVLLAFAVNLIELICSAGLPAVYTQVLSLSDLTKWQYYSYLLFYILVFMIDDLFVFFTAMITLQTAGIQGKYSRYSHLVGGVLMFIIGLLMIFKPEILMFG